MTDGRKVAREVSGYIDDLALTNELMLCVIYYYWSHAKSDCDGGTTIIHSLNHTNGIGTVTNILIHLKYTA